MAHIVLAPYGSRGTLDPFLAIAHALQTRGHTVRFAISEPFFAVVSGAGFGFERLPSAFSEAGERLEQWIYADALSPAALRHVFERDITPMLPAQIAALRAACARADLLIASEFQLPAAFVAELTGIPYASLSTTPFAVPSAAFASDATLNTSRLSLRPAVNRLNWTIGLRLLRRVADRSMNSLRESYGLPRRADILMSGHLSATSTSMLISPQFIPRPPDWPPHIEMTGFVFRDQHQWAMPARLQRFLDTAIPIVAIIARAGLSCRPLHAFLQTSVAAVRALGARALVLNMDTPSDLWVGGDDVYTLPFAPLDRVFPACRAVIHCGGLDAIAHALRAGVPMLVVPSAFDHLFNAACVANLGVGRWIRRREYSVPRSRAVLDEVMTTAHYRQQAAQVAARMQSENGVGRACDRLEALLSPLALLM